MSSQGPTQVAFGETEVFEQLYSIKWWSRSQPSSSAISTTVLPFEPGTAMLLRLTSIRPPPTLLLVPTHACPELNIHPWRCRETKAFGDFDEIEFVDVEDRAERMRGIGLEIGAIAVFG
jgi:hypothetical protein